MQDPDEMPLHVLLLSPTIDQMGGADRDWVTLANALGPTKIRITWAGKRGTECLREELNEEITERLLDLNLPWFTYLIQENAYERRSAWLWTKILGDHVLRLREPYKRLSEALRDDPPDIVVSNTAAVTLGTIYAARHRLPHIWCIKECLDPSVPACRTLARFMSLASSIVIAPSRAVAEPFAGRAKVIPDGSDVARIRNSAAATTREEVLRRVGLPVELPVIAQVGGVVYWKGQHVTADAFVRLSRDEPSPRCSLMFLGGGSGSHREKIEGLLEDLPPRWREVVKFVRFEPHDFTYLAAADIVVHPSVLPDPFPNAVREAMILGKPVVASRGGGIPEMILDGETGLLVRPGDPIELASAVTSLVASASKRSDLGGAAERYASRHLDIEARKDDFFTLMKSLTLKSADRRDWRHREA